MKNFSWLCALVLTFAACAGEPSQEVATSEAEAEVTEDGSRPDALNPEGGDGNFPAGWHVRLDSPSDDIVISADTSDAYPDIWFTTMTPGWHVTMKSPRAIFWHPASTASGDYSVSSQIFLFDPGRRNEAYGLIVGGSNLAEADQNYLYFLLRRSGEYLIKTRNGSDTENVVGWTEHEAILGWGENDIGRIANVLGIQTEGATISFSVNDKVVHSMDKGSLPTDGIVGFRLNHGVNVHVASLDVTQADG